MEESREKEVMEAALQAGHLLLENGAEISRVEETMERICRYYGVHSGNAFVLTNGIFVTVGNRNEPVFAKVEHIPVSGTHLDRVAAVNQLSREIEEGRYTIGQVSGRLDDIKRMPGIGLRQRCLLLSVWGKCIGQRSCIYSRNPPVSICAVYKRAAPV